jgi:hypothetical protein
MSSTLTNHIEQAFGGFPVKIPYSGKKGSVGALNITLLFTI